MTELSIIREKLDGIDQKIVELYQERMELCKDVAEYKIANGKMVLDRDRELQKLNTLKKLGDLSNKFSIIYTVCFIFIKFKNLLPKMAMRLFY